MSLSHRIIDSRGLDFAGNTNFPIILLFFYLLKLILIIVPIFLMKFHNVISLNILIFEATDMGMPYL